MDDSSKISMSFTTKPNDALFEANLKIEEKDGSEEFQLSGEINRLSLYGKTADCIDDDYKKYYCFCI